MTKEEKLINRLLAQPKDFTYQELRRLMFTFGYMEDPKGRSSGSRVAFLHPRNSRILMLHKPHPGNELKAYQVRLVIDFLKGSGDIV
jgi:hypothetical protein